MADPAAAMRNHWWWRPGWRAGRSFYTWHITFEEHVPVHRLAHHYAPVVERFSATLDPVEVRGLHATLQGIGFTDEISHVDVDNIVACARARCALVEPVGVTIGPAHTDSETIQMPIRPVCGMASLRVAIRQAIGDVWGERRVPERPNDFRPHVTLAYSSGSAPVSEVERALEELGPATAPVVVRWVSLINLNRDKQRYEWTTVSTVRIGSQVVRGTP